jgi:hypothetical protein
VCDRFRSATSERWVFARDSIDERWFASFTLSASTSCLLLARGPHYQATDQTRTVSSSSVIFLPTMALRLFISSFIVPSCATSCSGPGSVLHQSFHGALAAADSSSYGSCFELTVLAGVYITSCSLLVAVVGFENFVVFFLACDLSSRDLSIAMISLRCASEEGLKEFSLVVLRMVGSKGRGRRGAATSGAEDGFRGVCSTTWSTWTSILQCLGGAD